jgi:hypothetical protein
VGLQCSLDRAVHFVGSSDLGIGVIVVVRRNEDHSEVVVAGASEASEASATWQANSIRPLMAQAAPAGIALHSCPDDPQPTVGGSASRSTLITQNWVAPSRSNH